MDGFTAGDLMVKIVNGTRLQFIVKGETAETYLKPFLVDFVRLVQDNNRDASNRRTAVGRLVAEVNEQAGAAPEPLAG